MIRRKFEDLSRVFDARYVYDQLPIDKFLTAHRKLLF